jgi:hypothetical protein
MTRLWNVDINGPTSIAGNGMLKLFGSCSFKLRTDGWKLDSSRHRAQDLKLFGRGAEHWQTQPAILLKSKEELHLLKNEYADNTEESAALHSQC